MQLYYSPGACSVAPHILLEETGLAFEAKRVVIANGEHRTAEYRAINPRERVPSLRVDGEVLTEVPALLVYLAGRAPEARLIPAEGSTELAQCLSLCAFLSSSLHIAYAQLWRPERFLPDGFPPREREAFSANGKAIVRQLNREIDQRLGREWALDWGYSIADAYLFPFYRWAVRIGLPMKEDCPRWTAWNDRMTGRPAVRRALEREGIGFEPHPV